MAATTEVTAKVVSDKMAKSRVVAIERQVRHGMYGKAQRLTTTFMAHDEKNETHTGDVVAMVESGKSGGGTCAPIVQKIYTAIQDRDRSAAAKLETLAKAD